MLTKREKRIRRHRRVRSRIRGIESRPRFSLFRSNRHIWVALIDDRAGKAILATNDKEIETDKKTHQSKRVRGERVGERMAEKALAKNIREAVFDRGGYKYHGIVKAVVEGARKGGLKL